jgi:hypothetical protein
MNLQFLSDDALNNRIYASGKTKDLYAPNYDAFLWDWDVSGTTPTPIMEVLLSDNASSDSFYASKAYDNALAGARTARTQNGVVAAVRKAESIALHDLPYVPLVHLNAVEIARKNTWHGWKPSPVPKGRPLFETYEISYLETGRGLCPWVMEVLLGSPPPPPPPNVPALEENRGTATPKSVRERLEIHRRRSEEDRAPRVD